MKHVGEEIDRIIKERKLKQKDVAISLKMTAVNLSKILKKSSIDALLLEKIAKTFNLPITYFFDDIPQNGVNGNYVGNKSIAVAGSGNNFFKGDVPLEVSAYKEKVQNLENIIDEKNKLLDQKDKLLDEKERLIQILMQKNK